MLDRFEDRIDCERCNNWNDGVDISKYEYPLYGKIIVYFGLLAFTQYIVFSVGLGLYTTSKVVPYIIIGLLIVFTMFMDRKICFFHKMNNDPVLRTYPDRSWKWGGFLYRTVLPNHRERDRYPFLIFFAVFTFASPLLAVVFIAVYMFKTHFGI